MLMCFYEVRPEQYLGHKQCEYRELRSGLHISCISSTDLTVSGVSVESPRVLGIQMNQNYLIRIADVNTRHQTHSCFFNRDTLSQRIVP